MTDVDLILLSERVAALGRFVLRGDVVRRVERLAALGREHRAIVARSLVDPLQTELCALVDDFGQALVLGAVARAGARLRTERTTS
jgi:hypothetical protein